MYEHRCLENINKLYISAGKWNDQHQCKSILEAAMVSTTEIFTDKIPMSPGTSVTVRNSSSRKALRLFT